MFALQLPAQPAEAGRRRAQLKQLFGFCGTVTKCDLVGEQLQLAMVEYATPTVRAEPMPACMSCIFLSSYYVCCARVSQWSTNFVLIWALAVKASCVVICMPWYVL